MEVELDPLTEEFCSTARWMIKSRNLLHLQRSRWNLPLSVTCVAAAVWVSRRAVLCLGRTSYEPSGVVRFPLTYYRFLKHVLNIFFSISWRIIFLNLIRRVSKFQWKLFKTCFDNKHFSERKLGNIRMQTHHFSLTRQNTAWASFEIVWRTILV